MLIVRIDHLELDEGRTKPFGDSDGATLQNIGNFDVATDGSHEQSVFEQARLVAGGEKIDQFLNILAELLLQFGPVLLKVNSAHTISSLIDSMEQCCIADRLGIAPLLGQNVAGNEMIVKSSAKVGMERMGHLLLDIGDVELFEWNELRKRERERSIVSVICILR